MPIKKESFLPGFANLTSTAFHGGKTKGKRKTYRPIDLKQALHVVLHSVLASGQDSMLHSKHRAKIHDFVYATAKRCGIRIYGFENVGNHVHLALRVSSRILWAKFIRILSGGIAQIITKARKGAGLAKNASGRGFWDGLVFTRIIHFGRDFENIKRYLLKNLLEAEGFPIKQLLAQGYQIRSIGPLV